MKDIALQMIGGRLRSNRERLGFRVAEVAGELGVSEATYRRYEAGTVRMGVDLLLRLYHLGFEPMYIIYGCVSADEVMEYLRLCFNDKQKKQFISELLNCIMKME